MPFLSRGSMSCLAILAHPLTIFNNLPIMSPMKPIPILTQREKDSVMGRIQISNPDECWNWIGGIFKSGYGCIWIGSVKANFRAHRVAYFLFTGIDPLNLDIL